MDIRPYTCTVDWYCTGTCTCYSTWSDHVPVVECYDTSSPVATTWEGGLDVDFSRSDADCLDVDFTCADADSVYDCLPSRVENMWPDVTFRPGTAETVPGDSGELPTRPVMCHFSCVLYVCTIVYDCVCVSVRLLG